MRSICIAAIVVCFSKMTTCEVVISEILANEPGGRVLLEWLELYNNSSFAIEPVDYVLVVDEDSLSFPDSLLMPANSYVVFCRRLEPVAASDCFEYRWGDSSGVWNDSPLEDYAVYEIGITLTNSNGSIYLVNGAGQAIDYFSWDQPADDGRSVERDDVTDPTSSWHPCYDLSGSTPGRQNSQKPEGEQQYFLEVNPRLLYRSQASPINITYAAPTGVEVSIAVYDDTARRRATILDSSDNPLGAIDWLGLDTNGKPLPPGLYIISFVINGAIDSHKNIPLVIAP